MSVEINWDDLLEKAYPFPKTVLTEPMDLKDLEKYSNCLLQKDDDGKIHVMPVNHFVTAFEGRIRPYGKDESGQLVLYKDGKWTPDHEWLNTFLFWGLGSKWTTKARNQYLEALRDTAPTIGLGSEEFLNVQNGLLHWRTGNLHKHSPKSTGTVQLGTQWDPEAECPKWIEFLTASVAPDALDFLQEATGYALYMGMPFQSSFLLYGPGGSGKSTYIRMIQKLAGVGNYSTRSLQELSEDRFATADLFGKLLNVCADIDANRIEGTAVFKRLTGGDDITAQRKMERAFSFLPMAKLIFSANELPSSADVSSGWFRRWLVVEFPNGGKDTMGDTKAYEQALWAEMPGVLRWAVEGLQRLMERGKFDPPASVLESNDEYRRQIDSVAGWLSEVEQYSTGTPTEGKFLYSYYESYCEQTGVHPVAQRKFYRRLRDLGVPQVTWKGARNAWFRLKLPTD